MNIQHKVLQCPELFIHDLSTALHRSLVMQRETNQTQKTVALEPEQLGAWVLHDGGFRYLYAIVFHVYSM